MRPDIRRNRDPLEIVNEHIAKLAKSASTARRVGIDTLAQLRHAQLRALNDVRRDMLGRSYR